MRYLNEKHVKSYKCELCGHFRRAKQHILNKCDQKLKQLYSSSGETYLKKYSEKQINSLNRYLATL